MRKNAVQSEQSILFDSKTATFSLSLTPGRVVEITERGAQLLQHGIAAPTPSGVLIDFFKVTMSRLELATLLFGSYRTDRTPTELLRQVETMLLYKLTNPDLPPPLAIITGPAGSGKTMLARTISALIEKYSSALGGICTSDARSSASKMVILDNADFDHATSNILCSVANGDRISYRKLYSEVSEVKTVRTPIIVTSINDDIMAGRPDLEGRSFWIRLDPIERIKATSDIERLVSVYSEEFLGHFLNQLPEFLYIYQRTGPDFFTNSRWSKRS